MLTYIYILPFQTLNNVVSHNRGKDGALNEPHSLVIKEIIRKAEQICIFVASEHQLSYLLYTIFLLVERSKGC